MCLFLFLCSNRSCSFGALKEKKKKKRKDGSYMNNSCGSKEKKVLLWSPLISSASADLETLFLLFHFCGETWTLKSVYDENDDDNGDNNGDACDD